MRPVLNHPPTTTSALARLRTTSKLSLAGTVLTMGLPAIALAQPAADRASPEPRGTALERVIVTAQKREETAADVPIAVSVFDTAELARGGVLSLPQLTEFHPSVSFDTAQSFQRSSLKVRGIGTIGNSRTFEGAAGVFIDDTYRPRSGMVLTDLIDVGRLEILHGPQSTLFGKNTIAGTIVVSSTVPDVTARSTTLELRAGDYGMRYLSGVTNVPISDRNAVRIAGTWHERDGFFHSVDTGATYDNVDRYGIKVQGLLLRENLGLRLIADFSRSDANCCWGAAQTDNGPTTALVGAYSALNGLTYTNAPEAEKTRRASLNWPSRELVEDRGLTARIDWDLAGERALTSITSVRRWSHNQIDTDPDFVPADLFRLNEPADIDSLSQEINLFLPLRRDAGRSDGLLLGAYYATEDYESFHDVKTGRDADNYLNALVSSQDGAMACLPGVIEVDCAFPIGIDALLPDGQLSTATFSQESKSFGLFMHVDIGLTERLSLITGARYALDEKEGGADNTYWYDSAIVRQALESMGTPDDGTPRNGFDLVETFYSPSFRDESRKRKVMGQLSVEYSVSESVMAYAGFYQGYKAGGINLFREAVVTDTTTYDPEEADSFELGIKADYLSGRARTNVAVFDTELENLQINFFTGLDFRTENVGEAESRGIEIENRFLLTDSLSLRLDLTFLDAEFTRIDNPYLDYLQGRATPRSPDVAAVAALSYDRPLADGLTFTAQILASYMGDHYVGASVPSESKVDSYMTTDIQFGLSGREGRWDATVWCSNCSDETYRTIYFNSTFQPDSFSAFLNAPRMVGITLRSRF
jgi:iron complex outermembrane receptor protein